MPSAIQIRFAGCKGVLTLDPTLPEKKAVFRPSMRKFESPHRRLEVLQTSRPQVVFLNHQLVMLLSNLGVPDEVFLNLQRKMLDGLAGKGVPQSPGSYRPNLLLLSRDEFSLVLGNTNKHFASLFNQLFGYLP